MLDARMAPALSSCQERRTMFSISKREIASAMAMLVPTHEQLA